MKLGVDRLDQRYFLLGVHLASVRSDCAFAPESSAGAQRLCIHTSLLVRLLAIGPATLLLPSCRNAGYGAPPADAWNSAKRKPALCVSFMYFSAHLDTQSSSLSSIFLLRNL